MDRWIQFIHHNKHIWQTRGASAHWYTAPQSSMKENNAEISPTYWYSQMLFLKNFTPCTHPRKACHNHNPPCLSQLPWQLRGQHWRHFQSSLFSPANPTAQPGQPGAPAEKSSKHPLVPHMETRLPQRYSNPTGQCAVSSQNILPALHQQFLIISSFS